MTNHISVANTNNSVLTGPPENIYTGAKSWAAPPSSDALDGEVLNIMRASRRDRRVVTVSCLIGRRSVPLLAEVAQYFHHGLAAEAALSSGCSVTRLIENLSPEPDLSFIDHDHSKQDLFRAVPNALDSKHYLLDRLGFSSVPRYSGALLLPCEAPVLNVFLSLCGNRYVGSIPAIPPDLSQYLYVFDNSVHKMYNVHSRRIELATSPNGLIIIAHYDIHYGSAHRTDFSFPADGPDRQAEANSFGKGDAFTEDVNNSAPPILKEPEKERLKPTGIISSKKTRQAFFGSERESSVRLGVKVNAEPFRAPVPIQDEDSLDVRDNLEISSRRARDIYFGKYRGPTFLV